jgi:hypothetical protein
MLPAHYSSIQAADIVIVTIAATAIVCTTTAAALRCCSALVPVVYKVNC